MRKRKYQHFSGCLFCALTIYFTVYVVNIHPKLFHDFQTTARSVHPSNIWSRERYLSNYRPDLEKPLRFGPITLPLVPPPGQTSHFNQVVVWQLWNGFKEPGETIENLTWSKRRAVKAPTLFVGSLVHSVSLPPHSEGSSLIGYQQCQ